MLLFLLLYLSQNTTNAQGFISRRDLPSDSIPSSACLCPGNERSIWDILWSCLATIVACTWVSVHPNMSAANKPWSKLVLRRLELMFWATVAPELMIFWAMRQWVSARRLAERYRDLGWTKTHGYFVQMGGFMLFNKDVPETVLSPQIFQSLYETGRIDFPTITEEEIRDRSKADAFSKTIVIGQTVWFIIQCLARRAQDLSITALELLTLALAVLNGVMYFLWWNKPVDVGCYVPVYLLDEIRKPPLIVQYHESKKNILIKQFRAISPRTRQWILCKTHHLFSSWTFLWDYIKINGSPGALKSVFITSPRRAVVSIVMRMSDMMGGTVGSTVVQQGQLEIGMFFSDDVFSWRLTSAVTLVGLVFGGIHCLGWFFAFPSHPEVILWRISSSIITGSVVAIWVQLVVAHFINNNLGTSPFLRKYYDSFLWPIFYLSDVVFGTVYIVARIFLLVEAFISLRYLPLGTVASVKWSSFIPHI